MSKIAPILVVILAFLSVVPAAATPTPKLICDNSNAGVVFCYVSNFDSFVDFRWMGFGISLQSASWNVATFVCGSGGASGTVLVNFLDPEANIRYHFGLGVQCLPCGDGGSQ